MLKLSEKSDLRPNSFGAVRYQNIARFWVELNL